MPDPGDADDDDPWSAEEIEEFRWMWRWLNVERFRPPPAA
jgi:hypothetical protein